jgi:hypothetical protein
LRKSVADLPLIVDAFACELGADWRKALIQPCLEALNLVIFSAKVVARSIACQRTLWKKLYSTHSLKKAFAICNIKM